MRAVRHPRLVPWRRRGSARMVAHVQRRVWPVRRLLVTSIVAAALINGEGCGGADRGPTAPTAPSGPSYTISGVVTAYRGGPLGGVGVGMSPCNVYWAISCSTWTDQQGHYTVSSPGASPVGLGVGKEGYQTAWKNRVSVEDSTANFVLHPSVPLNPDGATLAETIWGDEFMAGDDVLFGGLCVNTPCKVIMFTEFSGLDLPVELRLRWATPTRQLALYRFGGDPDSIPELGQPVKRFCCSSESEVVANVNVNGYFDALAVAFEQAGGGPPGPADSQPFELTVRQIR